MDESTIGQKNPEIISASLFDFDRQTPISKGAEKSIYKVTFNNQDMAAKIYHEFNDTTERKQNRQAMAKREYRAYKRFQQSPLGIYIPEAVGLITEDDGNPVGIGLTWVDGQLVGNTTEKLLSDSDIDSLETTIKATIALGIYPESDMFNERNIIFAPQLPYRIRLAECDIQRKSQLPEYYFESIEKQMQDLKEIAWKPLKKRPRI